MNQPTPAPNPDSPEHLARRIESLEHASGFADRRADDLSSQMLALHEHVERLRRRVTALESRLSGLHDALDRPRPDAPDPSDDQ